MKFFLNMWLVTSEPNSFLINPHCMLQKQGLERKKSNLISSYQPSLTTPLWWKNWLFFLLSPDSILKISTIILVAWDCNRIFMYSMSPNQSSKSLKSVLSILVSISHGQHRACHKAGTQERYTEKTMKLLILLGKKSTLNVLCHSQDNVMCRKEAQKEESMKPTTLRKMQWNNYNHLTQGHHLWLVCDYAMECEIKGFHHG